MSKKKSGISTLKIDDNWRPRSDMLTLKEAEQIKGDKQRFAAAQKYAHFEMAAISKVTGASEKPQRGQRAASHKNLSKMRI